MSTTFNAQGVNFRWASGKLEGELLTADQLRVNPAMVKPMERLCEFVGPGGCIYTLGIRCDRLIRGGRTTSKHSAGLKSNRYMFWRERDGSKSNGPRAIDIRKIIFPRERYFKNQRQAFLWLVVTKALDRALLVTILRSCGFKCLHTGEQGDPLTRPLMIHAEVR